MIENMRMMMDNDDGCESVRARIQNPDPKTDSK